MSFNREQLLLAATGIVLAVLVLQAFQLSGMVNKVQNAVARGNSASLLAASGGGYAAPQALAPSQQYGSAPAGGAPKQVGGC